MSPVRVRLPYHLRRLAEVDGELLLEVGASPTIRSLLDALESRHPALEGTIRDHGTGARRDFIRYFACGRDLSFEDPAAPLPEEVASGEEPFRIVGAIAGG